MRMITDTMYFGTYKFEVELDTGSETGANQLTVWVAEKLNIDTVALKQFGVAQLLNALIEPERTRLQDRLEEEKCAFQHSFELEIAGLQGPFTVAGEKQGQKYPGKVKRKMRCSRTSGTSRAGRVSSFAGSMRTSSRYRRSQSINASRRRTPPFSRARANSIPSFVKRSRRSTAYRA